jgi:hypothetical protein
MTRRMRMHRLRIGVLCVMIFFVLGISLGIADEGKEASEQEMEYMRVPMGVIVLQPDESIEPKKSPVEFNHSLHFTYDCKACHHKWEGDTQISTCSTSECHDLLKSPKKPTKYLQYTEEGIKYYKYAYHQKCVGCHKEIKVERKKKEMSYQSLDSKLPTPGPTGCVECHPKE